MSGRTLIGLSLIILAFASLGICVASIVENLGRM